MQSSMIDPERVPSGLLRLLPAFAVVLVLAGLPLAASAQPQQQIPAPTAAAPANPLMMPGFWDPRRRPERPDLSRVTLIRFLTENDYPPFNYAGPDGNPAGFNVDLARMICEELKIACTIQMRRFDTLIDSLSELPHARALRRQARSADRRSQARDA
jgi:polar amino acid transport system substrate-binding protein